MENAHFCPVCEQQVEQFRPFGSPKRPNAQCPSCGSLERHRLAWCFFKARTNLFDGTPKSVLHVAPEKLMSKFVRAIPGLGYISADLESPQAMVKMDLTDIQFGDATFDVILCSHVLEHIPDDRTAMAQLYRVLKPRGWAVVQVPIYGATTYEDDAVTDPVERAHVFGQKDHVRKYGRDIKDRLAAVNFNVEHVRFARELSAEARAQYALKDQDIFYCTKR
jgi:SAM-dependent methyltransferase